MNFKDLESIINKNVSERSMRFPEDTLLNSIYGEMNSLEEAIGQITYDSPLIRGKLRVEDLQKSLQAKKIEFILRLEALEAQMRAEIQAHEDRQHKIKIERSEQKSETYLHRSYLVSVFTGIAALVAVVFSAMALYVSYGQLVQTVRANDLMSDQNAIMVEQNKIAMQDQKKCPINKKSSK